ncbi:hypothetical protein REPUB_Repub10bG0124100 [Reevesia pubescens]
MFGAIEAGRTIYPRGKVEQELLHIHFAQFELAGSTIFTFDIADDSTPMKTEGNRCELCLETEDVEAVVAKATNTGAVAKAYASAHEHASTSTTIFGLAIASASAQVVASENGQKKGKKTICNGKCYAYVDERLYDMNGGRTSSLSKFNSPTTTGKRAISANSIKSSKGKKKKNGGPLRQLPRIIRLL